MLCQIFNMHRLLPSMTMPQGCRGKMNPGVSSCKASPPSEQAVLLLLLLLLHTCRVVRRGTTQEYQLQGDRQLRSQLPQRDVWAL